MDFEAQVRHWLETETPSELISRDKYSGLDYMAWQDKWRIIKSAFPAASITFKEHWETTEGFHVVISIGVEGIPHDGLGFEPKKQEKQIKKFSDSGYKSAFSDAISRASVLLGVGLDLYGDTPITPNGVNTEIPSNIAPVEDKEEPIEQEHEDPNDDEVKFFDADVVEKVKKLADSEPSAIKFAYARLMSRVVSNNLHKVFSDLILASCHTAFPELYAYLESEDNVVDMWVEFSGYLLNRIRNAEDKATETLGIILNLSAYFVHHEQVTEEIQDMRDHSVSELMGAFLFGLEVRFLEKDS